MPPLKPQRSVESAAQLMAQIRRMRDQIDGETGVEQGETETGRLRDNRERNDTVTTVRKRLK